MGSPLWVGALLLQTKYAVLLLPSPFFAEVFIGGRYYNLNTRQKQYLLTDLQLMAKKLELTQILIDNGLPQLAKVIQDYKNALVVHNKKWQVVS